MKQKRNLLLELESMTKLTYCMKKKKHLLCIPRVIITCPIRLVNLYFSDGQTKPKIIAFFLSFTFYEHTNLPKYTPKIGPNSLFLYLLYNVTLHILSIEVFTVFLLLEKKAKRNEACFSNLLPLGKLPIELKRVK